MLVLGAAILISVTQASEDADKAPPIPRAGRLGMPRSLKQVGVPIAATRAAIPIDNPQTPAKVELGEKLFFDGRLSADGTVACSTCHDLARAFTDGRAHFHRIDDRESRLLLERLHPAIPELRLVVQGVQNGRCVTLAGAPLDADQHRPNLDAAVAQIASIPDYDRRFRGVFGRPTNGTDLARAIASYERTLVSFDSPFDHFIAGDKNAIDESAKRGWELFNTRARCNKCHALSDQTRDPTYFIDKDFHNIGIGIIRHNVVALAVKAEQLVDSKNAKAIDDAAIQTEMSVLGRYLVTKKEADIASFKTPTLRNVLITAPYFQDGSQATLWDVVDHYNKGDGIHNPFLDQDIQPLALSETDIDDIVAFMASLTSADYKEQGLKELARQRAISRTNRPQRDTARAFGPKLPLPKLPDLLSTPVETK